MQGENYMAHDRSKSEMTDTATISRTELHEREDKFSDHNERGPHARSVKMIKRSVPAYASDFELMRVAAQLSGLRRDQETMRSPGREPRIAHHLAHDRSKSEMTDTATISRTELHEREDKFSVHNERRPRARCVKMIKRSVPAYASDLELMRVAAELSGSRPDDQTRRSHRGEPRIPAEMQD
jgi:F420-dependent methylenetetrahydromethanopterin dehydrogenase